MKISVITACYNSEKTIKKTFESMLNQTYQDFEYIIVDGGSTDCTLDIIREYEPKFKGKMHIKSESDKGIYYAMNKGIARSNGELIGILNSDDWYEIDTLEKVNHAYKGNKYEVIYGMQRTLKNGVECSILFFRHEFLQEQMITHPTCFVTKKTYEDCGMFDAENYKSSGDYELMLRLYKNDRVVFNPVYSVLSNFNLGGISSSDIGVLETLRLQYQNSFISRKKYYLFRLKILIKRLIKY